MEVVEKSAVIERMLLPIPEIRFCYQNPFHCQEKKKRLVGKIRIHAPGTFWVSDVTYGNVSVTWVPIQTLPQSVSCSFPVGTLTIVIHCTSFIAH